MSELHSEVYIDAEGEQRCSTCDKWLERDYYTIDDHRRREAAKRLTQWGKENQPDE